MPKAPPFTAQNAAEKGRLGGIRSAQAKAARRAQAAADATALKNLLSVQPALPDDEQRRLNRVKIQADMLADKIDSCLADDDDDRLDVLTRSLARLWPLVTPTAGTLKPRQDKPTRRQQTEPIQPVTPQPIVSTPPPTDPPDIQTA